MDVLVSLATNVAYFTSIYLIFHCILTGHNFGRDFLRQARCSSRSSCSGNTSSPSPRVRPPRRLSPSSWTSPQTQRCCSNQCPILILNIQCAKEEIISSKLIHRGDVLKVLPGSRVAADGVLVEGDNVHVDESMITEEALPAVLKKVGDDVVGGTLNSGSAFNMRAVRVGAEPRSLKLSSW